MLQYILRRLLSAVPVMFGLSIILFAFIHLLPGDPAATILGQHARPELVDAMRQRLGLDLPLWQQYLNYMSDLLHGDLGRSFVNNRPVLGDFLLRFPGTIELTVAAMIYAAGLGIPLGRFAAKRPQSTGDAIVTVISLLGISVPIFVLGLSLQYGFSVQLRWLPATGRIDSRLLIEQVTHFMLIDTLLAAASTRSSTPCVTSSCRPSPWAPSRSRSSRGSPARRTLMLRTRTTCGPRARRA